MKKYLFMAVAAIAALSSCSSDNEVFNSEAKKALTFTATMERIGGDTRATFDNKSAKWEVGDEIYIMGTGGNATGASYVASGTNGTSTTFEPATPGQEVSGTTFQGFFPTYIAHNMSNFTSCEIPAEIDETWAEGKFNMPMYAMSNTTTLAFQNLCGVLAIKVNKDQLTKVKYIEISSSNRKLNGRIQPMPNSEGKLSGVALFYPVKDETYDDLGINYTTAVEIGDEGNVFYVPIPPSYNLDVQTMSFTEDPYKDLKILISDGSGVIKTMTTKKDKEILIERNKIYNITFKDNTPTTGKAYAKDPDCEVNWVQLWKDGPKFAEYNVGVTDGKAESFGGYYCWGGFVDNDPEMTYNTGSVNLTGEYDTATKLWGSNWRMPAKAELKALLASANCTWEFTTVGGVNGYKFTGIGDYASNSLFLPIDGEIGDYWTANPMPGSSESACQLHLDTEYKPSTSYSSYRYCGYSVRAVLNETK